MYGYEVMEDDYGAKLYLKAAEYADDQIRGEIVDFAHEKITSFLIDGKYCNAECSSVSGFFHGEAALPLDRKGRGVI